MAPHILFFYLAHFDAVVEGGDVQRAAALVVGGGGGRILLRPPAAASCGGREQPADEVLPAGVDGLVEGDVAAVVPQPQALRVAPVQHLERGQLTLGSAAVRRAGAEGTDSPTLRAIFDLKMNKYLTTVLQVLQN